MWFHPSYNLVWASPLSLDMDYLFLVGSNSLLLMVVQQLVAILEFSQEKMSKHPSTLPSCAKCNLKNNRMISVHSQGNPFNITVIQVYDLTTSAEEAEVERFYENLQDLLELTPKKKKDVLFIIGDWNAKIGSQEIPGETGKFGLGSTK